MQIKNLPQGATVIDYAYMIHTEIGNKMVAAKVSLICVLMKSIVCQEKTYKIKCLYIIIILVTHGANAGQR